MRILRTLFLSILLSYSSYSYGFDDYVHFAPDPINIKNGNLYLLFEELYLPSASLAVVVERTYNSYNKQPGPFGFSWSFNYHYRIVESPLGYLYLIEGDGFAGIFYKNDQNFTKKDQIAIIVERKMESDKKDNEYKDERYYKHIAAKLEKDQDYFDEQARHYLYIKLPLEQGTYISKTRGLRKIVKNKKGYLLLDNTTLKYSFDTSGRLERLRNGNGKTITFKYFKDRLISINDPYDRVISFTYDKNGLITKIIDPLHRIMKYTYDENSDLVMVEYSKNKIYTFTYGKQHELTSITYPDGSKTSINYDITRKAVTELNGPGDLSTKIDYLITNTDNGYYKRTITNGLGNTISYLFEGNKTTLINPDRSRVITEYNACCNSPTKITDENANTVIYDYDNTGNVTDFSSNLGKIYSYGYDKKNRLTWIESPHGRAIYSYDSKGNLIKVVDPNGAMYSYDYTKDGDLKMIAFPNDCRLSIRYDKYGNPATITDSAGHFSQYGYDILGRLTGVKAPNGAIFKYFYDRDDRLVAIEKPGKGQVRFAYDNSDNCISLSDEGGNKLSYSYDDSNNLLTASDGKGTDVQYTYDNEGHLTGFSNALGQRTAFLYNDRGLVTKLTDPMGHDYQFEYDKTGHLTNFRNPTGYKEEYRYDAVGRLITILKDNKLFLRFNYASSPPSIRMDDAFNSYITTYFDYMNRPYKVVDNKGNILLNNFDGVGNLLESTLNGKPGLSFSYDSTNRLKEIGLPGKRIRILYTYDNNGNLATMTDLAGGKHTFRYTADDKIAEIIYPGGEQLRFDYDRRNDLTKVTAIDGGKISYTYDHLHRLKSYQFKNDYPYQYEYDRLGNLKEIKSGNRTISYIYDDIGQMLQILHNGKVVTSFKYNESGDLISSWNEDTQYTYSYDRDHRLSTVHDLNTDTLISYNYDERGLKAGYSIGKNNQREWKFDGNLRLSSQEYKGKKIVEYGYDEDNRLTKEIFPQLSVTREHFFDQYNRLVKIEYKHKNNTIYTISYNFDDRHNVIEKFEDKRHWTYSYDERNRLISAAMNGDEKVAYRYDKNANRVWQKVGTKESRYIYKDDQLVQLADEHYSYDGYGNLTAITSTQNQTTFHYNWDNKLVEVKKNAKLLYKIGYDPFGRRYSKTDLNDQTSYHLYDGLNIIATVSKKAIEQFFYGFHELNPILYYNKNKYFLPLLDGMDSVLGVIDDQGKSIDHRIYLPFGGQLGKTKNFDFGFSSKVTDDETGLIAFPNRYYNPKTGSFLSRDPLGVNGDLSSYSYVDNNPLTFADPLGLRGFNYFYLARSLYPQTNGLPYDSPVPASYLPHDPVFPGLFSTTGVDPLTFIGNPIFHNALARRKINRYINDRLEMKIVPAAIESMVVGGMSLHYPGATNGAFLESKISFSPTQLNPTTGKILNAISYSPFYLIQSIGKALWRNDGYFLNLFSIRPGDPELVDPTIPILPGAGSLQRGMGNSLGGYLRLSLKSTISESIIKRFLSTRSMYGSPNPANFRQSLGFFGLASSTLASSMIYATSFLSMINLLPNPYSLASLNQTPTKALILGNSSLQYNHPVIPLPSQNMDGAAAQSLMTNGSSGKEGLNRSFPLSGRDLPVSTNNMSRDNKTGQNIDMQVPNTAVLPGAVNTGQAAPQPGPINNCY